jgi:DNA-3-methyladenine glycosylase II
MRIIPFAGRMRRAGSGLKSGFQDQMSMLQAPKSGTRKARAKPSAKPPAKAHAAPVEPPLLIRSEDALVTGLEQLKLIDPKIIGHMLAAAGHPPLRKREPGLEGLLSIVISQQVSTASARAILARFRARFETFDASEIASASDDDLRSCGLSGPKMRTMRAVCETVASGAIDLADLAHLPAEEAHARLVTLKGIGPWTADIYLLFCLGHPDILPVGDLALQEAAKLALGLKKRPDQKKLARLGQRWRPWRGIAARLLWAYYASIKQRAVDPASVLKS